MSQPSAIPGQPTAADIGQTLDSLLDLLTQGEETLAAGKMVDLAGLEREVQPILEAAVALPPDEARGLLPQLEAVMGLLDRVTGTMERVHGAKLGGSEAHATRMRATQAYRAGKDI